MSNVSTTWSEWTASRERRCLIVTLRWGTSTFTSSGWVSAARGGISGFSAVVIVVDALDYIPAFAGSPTVRG